MHRLLGKRGTHNDANFRVAYLTVIEARNIAAHHRPLNEEPGGTESEAMQTRA